MYCVKITIIGFCAFFIRVAWPYISWTGVAWMNYCLVAPISARSSLSVLCCAVPNKEIITKRELPIFKWPQMTADHHESVLPKNSFETAVKRNSNFSVKLQKCISCSRVYRISRVISYAFIIWRLKVYISKLDLWVEEQVLTPELGQLHSPECLMIFIRSIEILNECKFDDEMTELLIIVFEMPFMVKVFASCFKFIPDKFNALLDIWHPLPTSRRWTCHDPQRQFSHAIFM